MGALSGLAAILEPCPPGRPEPDAAPDENTSLAARVRGEYEEMPGLRLTVAQAARLFGLAPAVAHAVLDDLRRASVLNCSDRGTYSLRR
jgi:hypothetical protein